MLWVFIGLLGSIAFVFLTRLFWADAQNQKTSLPSSRSSLVTVAVVVLLFALLMLIATGKLNWISAAITAAIPFLRKALSLLRFAPLLRPILNRGKPKRPSASPPQQSATLTVSQARQMLEVSDTAGKQEIVAAHRRLMARNHPDRGGSNYIAAQLNTAKDLLISSL